MLGATGPSFLTLDVINPRYVVWYTQAKWNKPVKAAIKYARIFLYFATQLWHTVYFVSINFQSLSDIPTTQPKGIKID